MSTTNLDVLALEPYAAHSHLALLDGLARWSRHDVRVLDLPARAWKWRMRTSSLHFARVLAGAPPPDVLLVSDYVNLAELLALLPPPWRDVPAVVYFHENQLTYPLREGQERDHHFGLVHLHAALCARRVLFNSRFHHDAFLGALAALLARAPDVEVADIPDRIAARAEVLPIGIDGEAGAPRSQGIEEPRVLWAHRWEWDKGPEALLDAMRALVARGERFRLRLGGQRFREVTPAIAALRAELGERVEDRGFDPDPQAYRDALGECHVVLSTARHEFFGIATLEAIRAGCLPVLPDDLAYPELLPPDLCDDERFLYAREEGPVPTLRRALAAVREGRWLEERRALIAHTEEFTWPRIAAAYDDALEQAHAAPTPHLGPLVDCAAP